MSKLRASTYLIKIGESLKSIGLKSRWSVRHATHILGKQEHDYHVYSGSVEMLFRDTDIDIFTDHIAYLQSLYEREQRIIKLRSESSEFNEMMEIVDFALDLSKE